MTASSRSRDRNGDPSARSAVRIRVPDPVGWVRSLNFPVTAASVPRGVEPKVEPDTLGDRYDTEWARRPLSRWSRMALMETVGRAATQVMTRPEVRNLDRLEDLSGTAIFIANHHSHLDTTLLLTTIPLPWRHEMVVAAAADYFFDTRPKAALAAWAYGAVPMERVRISRRSADTSAELVGDGWSLLIFPEGGRSPDGWGQPHKGGAAYLSVRCGVPVVPVHLEGTRTRAAQGKIGADAAERRGQLRFPALAVRGRGRPPLRHPTGIGGGRTGRRDVQRLVVGPPPRPRWSDPVVAGSGRPVVAPRLAIAGPTAPRGRSSAALAVLTHR